MYNGESWKWHHFVRFPRYLYFYNSRIFCKYVVFFLFCYVLRMETGWYLVAVLRPFFNDILDFFPHIHVVKEVAHFFSFIERRYYTAHGRMVKYIQIRRSRLIDFFCVNALINCEVFSNPPIAHATLGDFRSRAEFLAILFQTGI